MLRDGQSKILENMTKASPIGAMPGMEAMRAQQEAFMKAMTGNLPGMGTTPETSDTKPEPEGDNLGDIKKQLAELQEKLSKLGK
jgi:polyhydroxyalkanoate synthesis regulator protein